MGSVRVTSVIGRHNAGKTTLLVALATELTRRGKRVMTLKHGSHPVQIDQPGKDTYRHFHEGRAQRVLIEAPGQRVLFERTEAEDDPETLIRRFLADADIVLVEGFRSSPLPKIEVHRLDVHPRPLFDAAAPNAGEWLAILTDSDELRAAFPVFRFNDTMWLVALTSLAWDRAKLVKT